MTKLYAIRNVETMEYLENIKEVPIWNKNPRKSWASFIKKDVQSMLYSLYRYNNRGCYEIVKMYMV